MATFAWLPEEVLVHIISFLDVDPPSKQRLRLEPTENIFDSNVCPLKHLSTTSRQLRRLTVPVLFKHVRLDFTPDEGSCLQLSALHGCIVRAAKRATGIAEKFLKFAKQYDLCSTVVGLLVYVRDYADHSHCRDRPDASVGANLAAFWQKLFGNVDLDRLVVLAPLADMIRITACPALQENQEYPATPDLKYQILEVCRDRANPISMSDTTYGFATKAPGPYRISPYSVLLLRKWTHVSLNEGSFLGAYGTLDWFERGAPRRTPSMLRFLFPVCCSQYTTPHTHRFGRLVNGLTLIDSFSYTAIFPPMDHLLLLNDLSGVHHFHHLRTLDLQIAPDLEEQGRILNEPTRVGRADLGECWEHVQSTYLNLRELLYSSAHTESWRLREVVCEDAAIKSLSVDLRDRFENLFPRANPPVADEWKAWGKFWKVIDASDGSSIAVYH